MLKRRQSGFTLIEIVIAILIIGVLVSIAIPQYNEQVKRARRSDAKAALAELAQIQEIYRADYHVFADSLEKLKAEKQGFKKDGTSYSSKEGYYTLSVIAADAKGFSIEAQADPVKGQKDDEQCRRFSINALGEKVAYDSSGAVSSTCW